MKVKTLKQKTMIGIIIWVILITAIAIISQPQLIRVLAVGLIIAAAVYVLAAWIESKFSKPYEEITPRNRSDNARRESAIREWEKKYNKVHPSRKIRKP